MDSKDLRFVKFLFVVVIIAVIYILCNLNSQPEMETWKVETFNETVTTSPTPIEENVGISVSRTKPTDWVSALTPTFTPEPTATPTPTFTVTNTPTPTPTPKPTKVQKPTKTPTPKPTKTPAPRPTPSSTQSAYPCEKIVPSGGHDWKPWARHTKITNKKSPQYALQKIAHTDGNGLRYCIDPYGEKRYCVALNAYWCGESWNNVGKCFDVVMANGSTIKCCLGDLKQTEHSQNGEGKFGSKGELLEFQVDEHKLNKKVCSDISDIGGEFEGEAVKIIVYGFFIEGFGE